MQVAVDSGKVPRRYEVGVWTSVLARMKSIYGTEWDVEGSREDVIEEEEEEVVVEEEEEAEELVEDDKKVDEHPKAIKKCDELSTI
jgi:hypothetical protein